jgi:hypothetical protein
VGRICNRHWKIEKWSDRTMGDLCVERKVISQLILYEEIVRVKESRNRPGVAQRVPGGLSFHIFMTFGTRRW